MEDAYYEKSLKCPVCLFEFTSTRIKAKAIKVKKKDEDFCNYYENYNPLYYEIFICPHCGYGASNNSFDEIDEEEKALLAKAFEGREIGRDFGGIRSYMDAVDSFKIALFTANLKKARSSIIAGLSLKIAWLYRFERDNKEESFLGMSLKYYKEAYDTESFSDGGIGELTVIYLIGELSRRIGKYEDAIAWFNRVINHPEKNKNPRIEKLAREQWRSSREAAKGNFMRK